MHDAKTGAGELIERLDDAIEAWNSGDLDRYMTIYADDVTLHGYGAGPMGKAAVREFYEGIVAGLPGSRIEIADAFGNGDRIVARFVQRGRHEGTLLGVPPTGRDVEIAGITIMAFRDGRVVERWASADLLGVLVQVGAVPAPA